MKELRLNVCALEQSRSSHSLTPRGATRPKCMSTPRGLCASWPLNIDTTYALALHTGTNTTLVHIFTVPSLTSNSTASAFQVAFWTSIETHILY